MEQSDDGELDIEKLKKISQNFGLFNKLNNRMIKLETSDEVKKK